MNIRDIKSGFYTKKKKKFIHKVNFMNKKFLFYEVFYFMNKKMF